MTSERSGANSPQPRFLLTFLAWAGGLAGGDRHLLEAASYWKQHVNVEVIAPPEAFPMIQSFLGQVRMHPRGSAGPRAAARGPFLALEYVRRAVSAAARPPATPDVVVAASHFSPDAVALSALGRRGAVGVAYVYHLVAERKRNDLRTLWSKGDEQIGLGLLRRHADVVFVSNRLTEAALVERGFAPVRTDVGLDLGELRRAPRDRGGPIALFLARMVDSKGLLDAVEAWAHVRGSLPEARLIMAGDGPRREEGMKRATQLGISDAIEWPGFVSEEEKRRLLGNCALLLAPSYEEGWGISIAEALATELPVVAYRLAVLDELFPSAYAAVTPGDIRGLANAVVRILRDPAYAGALREHGSTVIQRYDVSRVADLELEKILSLTRATGAPNRRAT
jgi:glycosyltransferase involved in cell wall biosynthesis